MKRLFDIEILHMDGEVAVALMGELDIAGTEALSVFRRLSSQYDLEQVTLWCSRLTFMDAAGLGALLTALRQVGGGGRPRLLDPTPIVRRVIELTGAEAFFEVDTRPVQEHRDAATSPSGAR